MVNLLGTIFSGANLGEYGYLQPIVTFLDGIVIPATVILAVLTALMAIVIAVMIAKADDGDKAKEMKNRLKGLFITVLIVIALLWLLGYVLSNFGTIMGFIRGVFTGGVDPS